MIIDKSSTSLIKYHALAKQLVLFQSPKLSLIVWKVKPVHLLIKEDIVPVAKTKKTWTLSETTRLKQSLAQQKRTKHPKPGFAMQVQDLNNNTITVYSSIREASRALNIHEQTISNYLNRNQTKPYKKRYVFSKI